MDKRFIVSLQGKDFITYEGLLNEAHTKGLKRISTRIIQLPDASNGQACVVTAEVELEGGKVFTGIGDASPVNVNPRIKAHLIRMAETRSKARALRDAVNIGMTAIEELGDGEEEIPTPAPGRRLQSAPEALRSEAAPEPQPDNAYPEDPKALQGLISQEMKAKGVSKSQMAAWAKGKDYPESAVNMTPIQLKTVLRYLKSLPVAA